MRIYMDIHIYVSPNPEPFRAQGASKAYRAPPPPGCIAAPSTSSSSSTSSFFVFPVPSSWVYRSSGSVGHTNVSGQLGRAATEGRGRRGSEVDFAASEEHAHPRNSSQKVCKTPFHKSKFTQKNVKFIS